nr:hypothetical protein CFP56_11806 [Quercus suber]
MPSDTKTFNAVLGGPEMELKDIAPERLAARLRSHDHALNLCARCSDTIFGPRSWAHLLGETLPKPSPTDQADYHISSELDGTSHVYEMFNSRPCSKKRGPMLDFKVRGKDILKSRDQSCGFCTLISILDRDGSILSGKIDVSLVRIQTFWPGKIGGLACPFSLEVGLHPGTSSSSMVIVNGAEGINIAALVKPVQLWLKNCESTHPGCCSVKDPGLPTRLLDLKDFLTHGRVHLVNTRDMNSSQYAVLSYVWGSVKTIELEDDSLTAFQDGVPCQDLPRTIGDCLHVVNALDIRYLWIDSLCIIQDSDSDKRQEFPRMSRYYTNACLVVSPSGATDVEMGFIDLMLGDDDQGDVKEREATRFRDMGLVPFRLPVHLPDHSASMLVNVFPIRYNCQREPFNCRAWTLQESILPRRLLTVLQSGGLTMQCREGETLEGKIYSNPYHELPNFASLGSISLKGRTADQLCELWRDLVQEYTRRSLSYRDDMLNAIAAMAKEFHAQHSGLMGSYVAGLWSNHILTDLLWHNSTAVPSNPSQHHGYLAPSWSWASSVHPVTFATAPEIYLPPSGNDQAKWDRFLGQVLRDKMVLRGVLTVRDPLRPLQRQRVNVQKEEHRTVPSKLLSASGRKIKRLLEGSPKKNSANPG